MIKEGLPTFVLVWHIYANRRPKYFIFIEIEISAIVVHDENKNTPSEIISPN